MLKHLSSVYEYRDWLSIEKDSLSLDTLQRLSSKKFRIAKHKLSKLDVGQAADILSPLYSHTGRPGIDPAIFIRSVLLMQHLGFTSLDNWCRELKEDRLLQCLIGSWNPPSVASYYDFIIRLTHQDPHLTDLYGKDHYKKTPKKKPKKNEKLINFELSETEKLYQNYKNGADFDRDRLMYTLQSLFNALVVLPSLDMGYIDKENLILSTRWILHAHSCFTIRPSDH